MWIVTLEDNLNDANIEVIAFDFDELKRILSYVGDSKDRFEICHVEKRWMCCGLDGLRDETENDVPDKI